MNVIILTGKFGMGHISAAKSIEERIMDENREANVVVIDFVEYMLPVASKGIYKGFNFMVHRCSSLYNTIYGIAQIHCSVPLKRASVKKIDKMLEDYNADLVINALPMCAQYMSAYKSIRKSDIRIYTVITDITAHKDWIAEGTDRYFVGDLTTRDALISTGVRRNAITVSGIPVRRQFRPRVNRGNCNKKKVLIIGGGLGLIPASDELLRKLDQNYDLEVTLIAGRNAKLFASAKKKFPRINTLGFTTNVDEYMRDSDIIISKAGGITTFEAIASETPIYVIKPFLEQEIGNAMYIEEHNIGRVMWEKNENGYNNLVSLLQNDRQLQCMRNNMQRINNVIEGAKLCS
ncbi:MAG: MGDG synthase family glycosyltransferase [Anaerovoracaceae bacterium]|jgi:processive 1,2-diacylglycerol beta-glucosyltransferase